MAKRRLDRIIVQRFTNPAQLTRLDRRLATATARKSHARALHAQTMRLRMGETNARFAHGCDNGTSTRTQH
eukprot:1099621-Lingulodinium_polyedra.AAC.1